MDNKTVTLINRKKCRLGKGVFGEVYVYKSVTGKSYAVKKLINKKKKENIIKEKNINIELYYSLPNYYKRYFVKPYYVKMKGKNVIEPTIFAMDIVPNGETAFEYLKSLYKKNDVKTLKLVLRRIRHAIYALWKQDLIHFDLHLNNIMVNTKTNIPKIIDFGRASKVYTKIPLKTLKTTGTTHLSILNSKIKKWFLKELQIIKTIHGNGNPNIVYFPNTIQRSNFYAKSHFNLINTYTEKTK